jgi:hypothetical protein
MRYVTLLVALLALTAVPACQSTSNFQPKAKLCVEAPEDLKEVNYKLEVSLN